MFEPRQHTLKLLFHSWLVNLHINPDKDFEEKYYASILLKRLQNFGLLNLKDLEFLSLLGSAEIGKRPHHWFFSNLQLWQPSAETDSYREPFNTHC